MTTEYLLSKEMEHVLAALTPQNALIMRLILHTGMRLGDAVAWRSVNLQPCGWYTEAKTGKRRRFGIPADLLEEIKAQAGPEWAFPGVGGKTGHKTRQAVWKDVKRASVAFRLPQNVGPHSGRKVYAVRLMRRYGDIERVRRSLNHESTTVTAIYAMADVLLERRLQARRRRANSPRGPAAGGGPKPPTPPAAGGGAQERAGRPPDKGAGRGGAPPEHPQTRSGPEAGGPHQGARAPSQATTQARRAGRAGDSEPARGGPRKKGGA